MSTNQSSWQVTPLEHVVHPEGNVTQKKHKKWVASLEHMVHPEGHVAQKKHKLASGTLGARGASWRAHHAIEANEASDTLGERSESWRVRRIDDGDETT